MCRSCIMCRVHIPSKYLRFNLFARYGIYDEKLKFAHRKCVVDVIHNPHKYGSKQVDIALWVMECHTSRMAQRRNRRLQQSSKRQGLLNKYQQKGYQNGI